MRNYTKIKRSKLGRVLTKVYKSEKVKKLIGYPDASSLRVTATGTNVGFKIKQKQGNSEKDLSNLTDFEISKEELPLDISKKAEVELDATQGETGTFDDWEVTELGYDLKFTDGSSVKRNIVSKLSGVGSAVNPAEPLYVTALTVDLPPPPGWLKLD